MKFVDNATIYIKAGDGGRGMSHFHREKCKPLGGPDGGHGGTGGSIYAIGSPHIRTLWDFQNNSHFNAEGGRNGGTARKAGRQGEDLILSVPCGTVFTNAVTGAFLGEILTPTDRLLLAKGGQGGLGNSAYSSSRNQAPTITRPPGEGEELQIQMELKLLADVGIIGAPNAGKSTLISMVSNARPKVGDYPFTTLIPQLGVVQHKDAQAFVAADIPGLIAGAHDGKGLGTTFLKHIQRTRVLVHMIDASLPFEEMWTQYTEILNELSLFDADFLNKPRITVLSKMDVQNSSAVESFKSHLTQSSTLTISSHCHQGLDNLLDQVVHHLSEEFYNGNNTHHTPFTP